MPYPAPNTRKFAGAERQSNTTDKSLPFAAVPQEVFSFLRIHIPLPGCDFLVSR